MARTFSLLKISIWADDDFLDLSMPAQWLYLHLVTHPELTLVGVTEWKPGRIAKKATALTSDILRAAADELTEARFLVIDEDSEEVLVRSFLRNDGVLKQPNMGPGVMRAYSQVYSRDIRAAIASELVRAQSEHPEWKALSAVEDIIGKAKSHLRAVPS